VLLLLASAAATMLAESVRVLRQLVMVGQLSLLSDLGYPLTTVLLCAALGAAAAGRHGWALGLMTAGMAAESWALSWFWPWWWNAFSAGNGWLWQLPIAAVLSLALRRWPVPAVRRPGRWLLAVPVALLVLPTQLLGLFSENSWLWTVFQRQQWVELAGLVGCLAWGILDVRVALAAGGLMLAFTVPAFLLWVTGSYPVTPGYAIYGFVVSGVTAAVPLAFGAWKAARQARL
jgi:hypothetical protein